MVLFASVYANAQFKTATLQAMGLNCAMCSNAITKSLKTIPFIEAVTVDPKNISYELTFKPGAAVDFDIIRKKVENAGFTVGSLTVVADFKELKVKSDTLVMLGSKLFYFVGVKEQVLNGEQRIKIINKYFVGLKEFKKYLSLSQNAILKTEKVGAEGKALGVDAETRVFNVTI